MTRRDPARERAYPLASLALLAVGCAPARAPLESAAYIADVQTSSIVVREITRGPRPRTLEVGPPAGPFRELQDAGDAVHHAFHVTGLEADRSYVYRLKGLGGDVIQEATFRTPPLPGGRAIRFLAVSDTGSNEPTYRGLHALDEVVEVFRGGARDGHPTLELVNEKAPRIHERLVRTMLATTPDADLLLHGGDLVGPGRRRGDYTESFFEPFALLIDHVPLYPAVGNHDVDTSGGFAWEEMFPRAEVADGATSRYYSFDRGDVHFIAIDVVGSSIAEGSPERAFIERDLARSKAVWKIAYFHVPPFSETKGTDNEPIVRDLVPLLEAGGVRLAISGNEHAYQRFHPVRGVTYVVLGPGGQPELRPVAPSGRLAASGSFHSFLRGTVDAQTLRLEAVDLEGRVFDSATIDRR